VKKYSAISSKKIIDNSNFNCLNIKDFDLEYICSPNNIKANSLTLLTRENEFALLKRFANSFSLVKSVNELAFILLGEQIYSRSKSLIFKQLKLLLSIIFFDDIAEYFFTKILSF
jgi:hypothetical protein